MSNLPREQVFDETIKNLEMKDFKTLAGLVIPNIAEAEDISLLFAELAMADMKKPDYIAKVRMNKEDFLLHLEFESNYKSNREMQKRMLRYCSYFYWNSDLPVLQVVVLMKEPDLKTITNQIEFNILKNQVMRYEYKIVKLYEMDKYKILEGKAIGLYPLRVFMKPGVETDLKHLKECLEVCEQVDDPDYYFLTVECGKKLYGVDIVEKIMKEAIYMSSILYKHPYEKGLEEGMEKGLEEGMEKGLEKGLEKGKQEELAKTVIKLLLKKFGALSEEMKTKLKTADLYNLEIIADSIFDLKTMDDAAKYLP